MSLSNKIFDKESFYATTYGKEKHLLVKDVREAIKELKDVLGDLIDNEYNRNIVKKALEIFGEKLTT